MNHQEQFQNRITDAVNKAAANAVHPAIIYMVLGGIQQDVLNSVRAANRAAAAPPSPPAGEDGRGEGRENSQPSTLDSPPPAN